MSNIIEFGIGFVTGRPNVCKLINSYYKDILKQVEGLDVEVKFTFFILYDMRYQFANRVDFYGVIPDVYKNITIKYITPEDIEEEKKKLISRYEMKKDEVDLLLGHGHAKGRNTVMYYALKRKIDYLLFWDDDEYPVAVCKNEDNSISWVKQNNILEHLKYIKDADITIGNHCGYISPIPYIEIGNDIDEEDFRNYIEAISNDIISWENVKEKFKKYNGVTYVKNEDLKKKKFEIKFDGIGKWVAGSTLCLNMKNIDKIPAFYNPEGARGEDTFFSTMLENSKVIKVPQYHFHDGFLKYTNIMKERYPKTLRKISFEEDSIEYRFLQASLGWIKYKPLYLYISNRKSYKNKIEEIRKKLQQSVPKINKMFSNTDFNDVIIALDEYDKNVQKCYKEYQKTNEVWNKVKILQ